jgi:tRNA (guanine37-N1)-methyltransferase
MVVVDALSRHIEGVLHSSDSTESESFEGGLLEYPQYTKPREFMGLSVPDILVSGDHGKIDKWRKEQAEIITKNRRPDIMEEN